MRYPTRGYQTRSRASNQTRHEDAGLPEDDIENGPILGAESGDGTIMPLDRRIYISVRRKDAERCNETVEVELYPVKNRRGECREYVTLAYNGAFGQFDYFETDQDGRISVQ